MSGPAYRLTRRGEIAKAVAQAAALWAALIVFGALLVLSLTAWFAYTI